MYNTNIIQSLSNQTLVNNFRKFIEFLKLFIASARYVKSQDEADVSFVLSSVFKGQTVIDIGSHKGSYLYRMVKRVGSAGKVIAFETQPLLYNLYSKFSCLPGCRNIQAEPASYLGISTPVYNSYRDKPSQGASIISFSERVYNRANEMMLNTLDYYCEANSIVPDFIKIGLDDKGLNVLQGSKEVIKKYKPVVMIRCEERILGRQKMLEIFKFFAEFNYKGYFILDTIKIPLDNFEFELYQNCRHNFCCNHFVFE